MTIRTDTVRLSDARADDIGDGLPNRRLPSRDDLELERIGAETARGDNALFPPPRIIDVGTETLAAAKRIHAVVTVMNKARADDEQLPPAAQWLLDNAYVVEDAVRQVRRDLPKRFYRELPQLDLADGKAAPRALAIAWAFANHGDGVIGAARFEAFVRGYQSVQPLMIGELWALPSLLRYVLLINLDRVATDTYRSYRERKIANELADRQAGDPGSDAIAQLAFRRDNLRDTAFASQIVFRLRDGARNAGSALEWLRVELERLGTDPEQAAFLEQQRLSAGNAMAGVTIRGLRRVNDIDWTLWFEGLSAVDAILRDGTDFAALDFASRDQYRKAVEGLSKRARVSEADVAAKAVTLAAERGQAGGNGDVGQLLVGDDRPVLEKAFGVGSPLGQRFRSFYRTTGWAGIGVPVLLVMAILTIAAAAGLERLGLGTGAIVLLLLFFAFPASEAALGLFNALAALLAPPRSLVGYEYKAGVPADARTLVVVPTLIGTRDEVDEAVRNLEVHYLSNMEGEIHFAILSDWPDASVEQAEGDAELLDLARARVDDLNRKHPREGAPRFFLLHRRRVWSAGEGCWMGWERKRGKLEELNALLRGDAHTTYLAHDPRLPMDVRFVMTLDSDTRMTRDAVRRLVGKMQHPLNRPVIDAARRRVVSGHAILQPRVTPSLTTGDEASLFQRVFSANRGMDPYVFAVSNVYQDVFGSGSFTGKGLYQVDAMRAVLEGRIEEGTVLSHDLLEGAWANAGFASDVELVEDYPTRYTVDAARHHRWTRGDWQLLPLLFSPSSGVPGLSRWKMIDNLRRSLMPIAWIAASSAGWAVLPLREALLWQAVLMVCLFFAPTVEVIRALIVRPRQTSYRGHVRAAGGDFVAATGQVVLSVAFSAHIASSMADAILRTLYRMSVSRRRLLEWRTASHTARAAKGGLLSHLLEMWGVVPVVALALLPALLAWGAPTDWLAVAFGLLWLSSPVIAWAVSRPLASEERLAMKDEVRTELRIAARRTWRYFETFVTAEHNMLPPDNFQEAPSPVVAARTSPTNVGMYFLSVIAARDFGWISLAEAVERGERTLAVLERLPRHRGHLFNWYDTRSLAPLAPRYVSSVDSGNLAGHLLTLAAAYRAWAEAPAIHLHGDFGGISDVTGVLEEALADMPDDRRSLRALRQRLIDRLDGMRRSVDAILAEPATASMAVVTLPVVAAEIRKLASALHAETATSKSRHLLDWAIALEDTCAAHVADVELDDMGIADLRKAMLGTAERARRFALEMDFSFLLRKDRKLLSIGYRVDEDELDEACYDLLASEARLTSLFGIAKGDLPTEHWFRLGRPLTEIAFRGALVSWSGSMFEYLMPPLVMKEPLGGLLNQSSNLAIRRHIAYGRAHDLPWGISEAAYSARDQDMNYQYQAFGVPGLGLKRGLAENMVVAPYASFLAAQFEPSTAAANLRELRRLGALGAYGYIDAVDFTPERLPAGKTHVLVRNYMAHHQGMSIVAIGNAILNGRMRDRFHADPLIEAAELLLQEKAPRQIVNVVGREEEGPTRIKAATAGRSADIRRFEVPANAPHSGSVLSNGRYGVFVTAQGTGYSRSGDVTVTRWAGDPSEDRSGSFVLLTDVASGDWWSATGAPKAHPAERAETILADDRATFRKWIGTLRSEVDVIVLGEGDGEARRVTLVNEGLEDKVMDLTSFAEIVLGDAAGDRSHPAFAKMFVRTEIAADRSRLYAMRNPRSPGEPAPVLAHVVTAEPGIVLDHQAETDRRAFIGRGRDIADPAAMRPGATLAGGAGFVLDPVAALRCRVRVPAGKRTVVTFWTVVAPTRAETDALVERLVDAQAFDREAAHAWTRSQIQTRHHGLTLVEAAGAHRLAGFLHFAGSALRAAPDVVSQGLGSQAFLWPASISGDHPIVVLRVTGPDDFEAVATALRLHGYLRARGVVFDLVVLNEELPSYAQDFQQQLERLCSAERLRQDAHGPGHHIFALRADRLEPETFRTIVAAARVLLNARNGTIFQQLERAETLTMEQARQRRALPPVAPWTEVAPDQAAADQRSTLSDTLDFWNGFGGFDEDGRDYVVHLDGDRWTPQPWINVVANAAFGFQVSAEGASATWSRNSRDFQLTPWSNDPVTDRPGEGFYIVDRDTGQAFAPTASVLRDPQATYVARHTQGLSRFCRRRGQLDVELTQLVDPADPVKVSTLTIANGGSEPARLRVYAYAEWVLGDSRSRTSATVLPGCERDEGILTARNPYSIDHADRVSFLCADVADVAMGCDRAEFLGRGDVRSPAMVLCGDRPAGRVEAVGDPCAVIARDIVVAPGETRQVSFMLGDAGSRGEVLDLVRRHRQIAPQDRERRVRAEWDGFGRTLSVATPDPAFDHIVNHWLAYQVLACRVRARAAFYQASGAYGFRDQLQDTLALLLHDPSLARAQILSAASRQFPEGDVQHWWLPDGPGVRTRIADDVVWLAHAVSRYVEVTGDASILEETTPFVEGATLKPHEHDAFFRPGISSERVTLREHCIRALDLAVARTGASGLPLMLGGDWNDGMNRVGEAGRGESIWLGWFLLKTLRDFAPMVAESDPGRARDWLAHADRLQSALETHGWDGEWYRRAIDDDGTPLGSSQSDECRIDSIAQSWAVLSGGATEERGRMAVASAMRELVDPQAQVARLFSPPFAETTRDPGYIRAYPPGVRENGGQYTHAAAWLVLALTELGQSEDAYRLFSMLNPINHALDAQAAERYRVEPYVVAADVHSGPGQDGRGGWTWYTGSAGWLYRAAVEGILGIRRMGDRVLVRPSLPPAWNGFEAVLRLGAATWRIEVRRGAVAATTVDGAETDGSFPIAVEGDHVVTVIVAAAGDQPLLADQGAAFAGSYPSASHKAA
ncbi:protein ndvB [Aquibium carbonis]|uniref:Protein ndvB n=1 Tax=Aquibium carbonis TaxID=2495581 RepID=A0A429Z0P6_9HYPH|nr:glucoamylase family protein [Aquibium carbonis]RST87292.1 protein ndvB [Aquibium carbonis]